MNLELHTSRLLLRPTSMDDLDDFHRIISSAGITEGTLSFPEEPDEQWARERLQRVCATTWTWNQSSSKLLSRAGFTREGRSRQHYCKNGEYIDADEWGMLASDPRPWKE